MGARKHGSRDLGVHTGAGHETTGPELLGAASTAATKEGAWSPTAAPGPGPRSGWQVGAVDAPEEHEAERLAETLVRSAPSATARSYFAPHVGEQARPPSTSPADGPHPTEPQSGGAAGRALDERTRRYFEPRLRMDLRDVRVHTNARAASFARANDAVAYTTGRDIVFSEGAYAPHTDAGLRLLAHELVHVAQQGNAPEPVLRRQSNEGGSGAAATPPPTASPSPAGAAPPGPVTLPTGELPILPPEWLRASGGEDLLVAVSGGRMLALPAAGNVWRIAPPVQTGTYTPPPFLSVPTVGKEGLVGVRVGAQLAYLLDAGGDPATVARGPNTVVSVTALEAIHAALGTRSVQGLSITHIHSDHVRAFTAIVREASIRPENVLYPSAFTVNLTAPSSVFARALSVMGADPVFQPLGYGAGARFREMATPGAGTPSFFRTTTTRGEVTFDYYGLTQPFQKLQANRAAGREVGSNADTASLLTRVTHTPTGTRALYVGDLRGADLELFRTAMTDAAYREMLSGVRVIQGFQHHMGTLGARDEAGLIRLLQETQLRSGSVTVMVQSSEKYSGGQFLNRSLMAALAELGIDVHVAQGPQGGQVGTFTVDVAGSVTGAGGGRMETLLGNPAVRAEIQRLVELREVEETLTRYGRHVGNWGPLANLQAAAVRQAREELQRALEDYVAATLRNVRTGATGRAQQSVADPAVQAAGFQRIQQAGAPLRPAITPPYLEAIRELNRMGPHIETYLRELEVARSKGRMSEAGISALWEVNPEMARRLVRSSGMSRREQQRTLEQLPGQGLPVRMRAAAGFLLALEVFNQVAPLIRVEQQRSQDANVGRQLNDLLWWQDKGVFTWVQAVNNGWFRDASDMTTERRQVQAWLNDNNLAYLGVTGIPEEGWDTFTIWCSANIHNYSDWNHFITQSGAIRGRGAHVDELEWDFRQTVISTHRYGYSVQEKWEHSPRLTTILRATARHMVRTTESQLSRLRTEPGARHAEGPAFEAPERHSRPALGTLPRAAGRMRFRANREPRLFTLAEQRERVGYSRESVFHTFPASASPEPMPSGYVLVGGADYNTYIQVYNTVNLMTRQGLNASGQPFSFVKRMETNTAELLLALHEDLEPAP